MLLLHLQCFNPLHTCTAVVQSTRQQQEATLVVHYHRRQHEVMHIQSNGLKIIKLDHWLGLRVAKLNCSDETSIFFLSLGTSNNCKVFPFYILERVISLLAYSIYVLWQIAVSATFSQP